MDLCPDPTPPPKQASLLMCDPVPSHLLQGCPPSVPLLAFLLLSTILDSHQHAPTMSKVQNSDGVLLDPSATPFTASLQQALPLTSFTPLSTDGFRSATKSQGRQGFLCSQTQGHASVPNPWPCSSSSQLAREHSPFLTILFLPASVQQPSTLGLSPCLPRVSAFRLTDLSLLPPM